MPFIAIGAPYADDSAIVTAAEVAGLTQFVNRHPKGFDMLIGERGESLSGGQRQEVAIARAVLMDPPVLFFDEPTSGLDYFHMMQVAECIKKMHEKGRTIFLITHDLELIYSCCNYIIHIENGMIKELYQVSKENEPKLRNFFEV